MKKLLSVLFSLSLLTLVVSFVFMCYTTVNLAAEGASDLAITHSGNVAAALGFMCIVGGIGTIVSFLLLDN